MSRKILKYGTQPIGAGALSFTIGITLVITLLVSSLIMLGFYYRQEQASVRIQQTLTRNLASAQALMLATSEPISEPQVIDLFGSQQDSVRMQRLPWGLWDWVRLEAFQGPHARRASFLLGEALTGEAKSALYLSDRNRPLSLSGATDITGTVYLPSAGIKSTYVDQRGFEGATLVRGEKQGSGPTLYPFPSSLQDRIYTYLASPPDDTPALLPSDAPGARSVFAPARQQNYTDPIVITDSLRGPLIVRSEESIRVTGEARLEQVLLIAPRITLEAGFTGQLQAFASQAITLEADVTLTYPSALVLRARQAGARITIGEASHLTGALVMLSEAEPKPVLTLSQQASLEGWAYAQGWVELAGSLYGHLACEGFRLTTPSTVYENHLLDATLNYPRLSRHYVGPCLTGSPRHQTIVQWLDAEPPV